MHVSELSTTIYVAVLVQRSRSYSVQYQLFSSSRHCHIVLLSAAVVASTAGYLFLSNYVYDDTVAMLSWKQLKGDQAGNTFLSIQSRSLLLHALTSHRWLQSPVKRVLPEFCSSEKRAPRDGLYICLGPRGSYVDTVR